MLGAGCLRCQRPDRLGCQTGLMYLDCTPRFFRYAASMIGIFDSTSLVAQRSQHNFQLPTLNFQPTFS